MNAAIAGGRIRSAALLVLCLSGGVALMSMASDAVGALLSPPAIAKSFSPASIPLNGTSTMTLTITNPNAGAGLSGVAFTDTFPAGLAVAGTPALTNTCGGAVSGATAGSTGISLAGGALPAGGSCAITVSVTGTVATSLVNTTGPVASTEDGPGNSATAVLTVLAPPTIGKGFGVPSIPLNGTTYVHFSLSNPNVFSDLHGVGFTDTLPAGLVVAPGSASNLCGGTLTAVAGTNTISLAGATIPSVQVLGGTCFLEVNVTGILAGSWNNTTGPVSSLEGGTGTASNTANLVVVAPPVVAKSFDTSQLSFNATATLSFTITNPAANTVPLTGVGFTDTFPTGLLAVASPNGLTGTCGGGTITAVAGANSVSLSGATLPVGGSCAFSVQVVPIGYGTVANTVTVVSGNGGTGNTAAATVVLPQPQIPALGPSALLLLTFAIGGAAGIAMLRRRRPR